MQGIRKIKDIDEKRDYVASKLKELPEIEEFKIIKLYQVNNSKYSIKIVVKPSKIVYDGFVDDDPDTKAVSVNIYLHRLIRRTVNPFLHGIKIDMIEVLNSLPELE